MSSEAYKSLYGRSRKAEINLSNMEDKQVILPSFTAIMKYIKNEDKELKPDSSGKNILPYPPEVCKEVNICINTLFSWRIKFLFSRSSYTLGYASFKMQRCRW